MTKWSDFAEPQKPKQDGYWRGWIDGALFVGEVAIVGLLMATDFWR